MAGSLIGTEVVRVEDPALLTGLATYVDNHKLEQMVHVAFVRSPYAHAVLGDIDVADASTMPGVHAVYTAKDLSLPPYHSAGFPVHADAARPPLAVDRVRFVGEAVAVVVADTKAQAADAVDSVIVEYESLPAVIDPEAALASDAPVQFDSIGSNLVGGLRMTNVDEVLADADVVIRGRFENQRMAVVPMEGNSIIADPRDDGAGHQLTLHVATQMPHAVRGLASQVFGLEPGSIRVVAPHVGGGFGGKVGLPSEFAVAIAVARHLGRPVKWVETRSENMLSLPHGRGQIHFTEMGFRRDGTITGLRIRVLADAGAYAGIGGQLALMGTRTMAQGVYRIPKLSYNAAIAVTNTTPMGALRGAGRPEAAAFLERIMDMAADELEIDPAEIRRRNLIRPDEFPFTTRIGTVYDSGDYDAPLVKALALAGYAELLAEQAQRRERNDTVLLGIGIGVYVEITAAAMPSENASIDVDSDGLVTVMAGTSAHGQGHATTFAMIVADTMGVPMESIRYVQSDTALIPEGFGTGGSRSLQIGGTAVLRSAQSTLEKAKQVAAKMLEAALPDIEMRDGRFGVVGVPSIGVSWAEVAAAAKADGTDLATRLAVAQRGGTFPFGAHVAVVEVDRETGHARLRRHIAVDDCGRIVNPMIVRGQQHGGIAQGVAQALWEKFTYDAEGNPLTSTLAEYGMPSAAELPSFEVANTETSTPLNPLGAKGIGESATVGSAPAVQNAVVDALSHLGVRHLDMPCTPERVWRAIEDAREGRLADPWREPPSAFERVAVDGGGPTGAPIDL